MGFMKPPKVKTPKPPPAPPSLMDAALFEANAPIAPFSSLVSTSPQGLLTRANTSKRSLIGGSYSGT